MAFWLKSFSILDPQQAHGETALNPLQWIYETLPNLQLLDGKRGNLMGILWLFIIGYLAYKPIRSKFTKSHWFYSFALGVGLAYLFHICFDELLNMNYVIWGAPFVFGYPRYLPFDFIQYMRIRFKNYLAFVLLPPALFYKSVDDCFQVTKYTVMLFLVILVKDSLQAIYQLKDYAVLTGQERIEMYWLIYPMAYILYGLFIYSLLKRKQA